MAISIFSTVLARSRNFGIAFAVVLVGALTGCAADASPLAHESSAHENLDTPAPPGWSDYTTGPSTTYLFTWTHDNCCLDSAPDQKFSVAADPQRFLQMRFATSQKMIQDSMTTPGGNSVAGPGVYFAEDPALSSDFGDTLIIVPVRPAQQLRYFNRHSLEFVSDTETLNTLNSPEVPAIMFDYIGLAKHRAVVVRDAAFLDIDAARSLHLADRWLSKNRTLIPHTAWVDRGGTLFDLDGPLPAAPQPGEVLIAWLPRWSPYFQLATGYSNGGPDDADRTSADPTELSDAAMRENIGYDVQRSLAFLQAATTACPDALACLEGFRAIMNGEMSSAGQLTELAIPVARALGFLGVGEVPSTGPELATLVLPRYKLALKQKGAALFAMLFAVHEWSRASSLSAWQKQ